MDTYARGYGARPLRPVNSVHEYRPPVRLLRFRRVPRDHHIPVGVAYDDARPPGIWSSNPKTYRRRVIKTIWASGDGPRPARGIRNRPRYAIGAAIRARNARVQLRNEPVSSDERAVGRGARAPARSCEFPRHIFADRSVRTVPPNLSGKNGRSSERE